MNIVEVTRGDSPIVLGLPHTGTFVPDSIMGRLNARGQSLSDTDWHIHKLYDGLLEGITTVRATTHRYVIDVNRDPSGRSLYPGQNTTGMVPLTDFDGHEIWEAPPTEDEIAERRRVFHDPYHSAMHAEVDRVHALHGSVIHYDCHSIRSKIPFLFDGTLPDFNIGTNDGQTCDPRIEAAVETICDDAEGYSSITNGRFRGGWTTRHYGRPDEGYHAIQMELAQSTYLTDEQAPWVYDTAKSERLRVYLREILTTLADLAPTLTPSLKGKT